MFGIGYGKIWAFFSAYAWGFLGGVGVSHGCCWVQPAGLVVFVLNGATASAVVGSAWLPTFVSPLSAAFETYKSRCFAHKASVCGHDCIHLGTSCHRRGSLSIVPALVVHGIHGLFVEEWCFWSGELFIAYPHLAMSFEGFTDFEILVSMLFNSRAQRCSSDIVENCMFQCVLPHGMDYMSSTNRAFVEDFPSSCLHPVWDSWQRVYICRLTSSEISSFCNVAIVSSPSSGGGTDYTCCTLTPWQLQFGISFFWTFKIVFRLS